MLRPITKRSRSALIFAVVVLMTLAACGGENGTGDETSGQSAGGGGNGSGPVWDGDQLQPLADGFPEDTITLWCAQPPGQTDDLINQAMSEIAQEFSPVPITTDCRPSSPHYQWAMTDFLPQQPRGDEPAYYPIMTSRLSVWEKLWTIPEFCGNDPNALEPINHMMWSPYVIAVSEDSDIQTIEDAVTLLKENPDTKVVTSQPGSGTHTATSVWADEVGLDLNLVPVEDQAQTRQLLLGGGAEVGLLTYGPGALDSLRPLLVTGDQTFTPLPDVPSAGDKGWNVPSGSARGYVLLAGVPEERQEWLKALFERAVQTPAWKERFSEEMELGLENEQYAKESVNNYLDAALPILEDAGLTRDCPIAENRPFGE